MLDFYSTGVCRLDCGDDGEEPVLDGRRGRASEVLAEVAGVPHFQRLRRVVQGKPEAFHPPMGGEVF